MVCRYCGEVIEGGNKFCVYCGKSNSINQSTDKPKGKEVKIVIGKSFFLKITAVMLIILIAHIIFSERPFYFLVNDQEIDQEVLTGSVVNILCDDGESVYGGSGTMVDSTGIVLTNSHVIPQYNEYLLTSDSGCLVFLPNQYTGELIEVYWADPIVFPGLSGVYDLAHLEIYDVFLDEEEWFEGEYPKRFVSIFNDEHKYNDICQFRLPKLGDPVRVFGYPSTSGGMHLTVTEGVVSSFSDEGFILTSAKIDEGNSGGLAVDQKGCVVGVPVAVREGRYQNLGMIISLDMVMDFWNESRALYE